MNVPENLRYSKTHEWVRLEGDTALIGITEFAQSYLGDIVFIDLVVEVGDTLKAEDPFGEVEAVKAVSPLYMPIAGTVIEINANVIAMPGIINQDPFGAGWILKVKLVDHDNNPNLLDSPTYERTVREH